MAIEIVDFPIKNGDFPWQNVSSPEGNRFLEVGGLLFRIWILFIDLRGPFFRLWWRFFGSSHIDIQYFCQNASLRRDHRF